MSDKDIRELAVKVANLLSQCPTGIEVASVITMALRMCNDGGYYAWYKTAWQKLIKEGDVELDITRYLGRAQW